MATLQNLTNNNDALAAALARIAELEAEKQAKQKSLSFKVTAEKLDEKTGKMTGTNGAVSVYGLGRFPITLYKGQWERLVEALPALQAFMKANEANLSVKS